MFLNKSLPVSIALIHFVQRALAGFLVVTPESEEGLLNVNIIIKLITNHMALQCDMKLTDTVTK